MVQLKVPLTPLDHTQGDDNAPVTLVEYGDDACPHCAAAQPVLEQIQAHSGNRLLLVYRHFPLIEGHPHAGAAAKAAEFAGAQGLFWQMHRAIFANQHRLNVPLLISLAANLRLSPIDLASDRFAEKVREDFIGGIRSGVNGTPTFFDNGQRFDSSYGVAALSSAIDQAIAGAAA